MMAWFVDAPMEMQSDPAGGQVTQLHFKESILIDSTLPAADALP